MKKLSLISCLFLCIYFCSCLDNKHNKKSKIFKNYLLEMNYTMPEDTHYYLLAPNFSCHNCIKNLCEKFSLSINFSGVDNVTFISSNKTHFPEEMVNHKNFIFDRLGSIDYLDLDINGLTIIKTSFRKIQTIKTISNENDVKKFVNEIKTTKIQN